MTEALTQLQGQQISNTATVKTARDETWVANIPVLTQFYFDNIFPRTVEGEL